MKQIARNYVWWDSIDADIERVCSECAACRAQRALPAPAPPHSWPWPSEPWSRLNFDFLGPFHNKYYLVIVDAHSKWIEVEKVSSTSATIIINRFRRLFAQFGLPKRIVSDNGPPFASFELETYLSRNGIKHTLVAPYHPASNGAAENAVRTIKRVLKKAYMENIDDNVALNKFLFMYRNTEHSTTGREPAVAMFGRRLRGRLDLLRADVGERVRDAQLAREQRRADGVLREFEPGAPVAMRDYSKNSQKWVEGEVVCRKGPVTYSVESGGRVHKRHVDQLLSKDTRKSRYSLIDSRDVNNTSSTGVSEGEPNAMPEVKVQLVESPDKDVSVSTLQSPTDQNNISDNRPRRRAAIECVQKLKNTFNMM